MVLAFGLVACDDESLDSGPARFYVESVDPADGTVESVTVANVYLQLSQIPDITRCTTDTIRVDAARDDGTVAFRVPSELSVEGAAFVKLRPLDPDLRGWTYAVSVQGGAEGCVDEFGTSIEPFLSTFEVP